MKINLNAQRYAVYYIVGYGTEIQNYPVYSVRWAGRDASGYSFGVTQTDIGSRLNERSALFNAYTAWRSQESNAEDYGPKLALHNYLQRVPLQHQPSTTYSELRLIPSRPDLTKNHNDLFF